VKKHVSGLLQGIMLCVETKGSQMQLGHELQAEPKEAAKGGLGNEGPDGGHFVICTL
jgi:hypothetical protein